MAHGSSMSDSKSAESLDKYDPANPKNIHLNLAKNVVFVIITLMIVAFVLNINLQKIGKQRAEITSFVRVQDISLNSSQSQQDLGLTLVSEIPYNSTIQIEENLKCWVDDQSESCFVKKMKDCIKNYPTKIIYESEEYYYCAKNVFADYYGDNMFPFCEYAFGNYSGIFSPNLFESGCMVKNENESCKKCFGANENQKFESAKAVDAYCKFLES